jgi:hypothetical protein
VSEQKPRRSTATIAAQVVHLSRMTHAAQVDKIESRGADGTGSTFTIVSDEPEFMGGDNLHPYPMQYFVAAVAF